MNLRTLSISELRRQKVGHLEAKAKAKREIQRIDAELRRRDEAKRSSGERAFVRPVA